MAKIEEIKRRLNDVSTTKVFFVDLNGRVMSLPINPERIERFIDSGVGFDGSSIAGYASVEQSDRILMPDPESFRVVPFQDGLLGFFVGHIYNERGDRSRSDPRAVLEKVLARGRVRVRLPVHRRAGARVLSAERRRRCPEPSHGRGRVLSPHAPRPGRGGPKRDHRHPRGLRHPL